MSGPYPEERRLAEMMRNHPPYLNERTCEEIADALDRMEAAERERDEAKEALREIAEGGATMFTWEASFNRAREIARAVLAARPGEQQQ